MKYDGAHIFDYDATFRSDVTMVSPIVGNITYTHNQSTTSNTWVINHNLNRYPSVTVIDSGGTIVQGTVIYNSNTQLTITFFSGTSALAFQGKAYLN